MEHTKAVENELKSAEVSHLGRNGFRLQDKMMWKDCSVTKGGRWSQRKGWFTRANVRLHCGTCEWEGKDKWWDSSEQYVRLPCGLVAPWGLGRLGCQALPVDQVRQGLFSWHLSHCPPPGSRAAGGSHSPGHGAPLWGWGWAKVRLGHQSAGGGPGQDQHGHGYKAGRDVTPRRRRLALMEAHRSAVWEPHPLTSQWWGVALSCTIAKLALSPSSQTSRKGKDAVRALMQCSPAITSPSTIPPDMQDCHPEALCHSDANPAANPGVFRCPYGHALYRPVFISSSSQMG